MSETDSDLTPSEHGSSAALRAQVEEFFEANVRIEKLFWLPGVLGCQAPPDDFIEALDEIRESGLILDAIPQLRSVFSLADDEGLDCSDLPEEVAAVLMHHQHCGFIFEAATPVTSNHRSGGGYTMSWGHYYTVWMYAETADDITRLSTEWAAASVMKDRQREAQESNASTHTATPALDTGKE